ncbi:helix-turn-helix domain-containing protein [Polaribacter staleyi]|uniref:helix-turn-helix domain-containing protein n=1 Tax=Polaribacter staleyi TaxID=2022337 RepID=UPI0031BBBC70
MIPFEQTQLDVAEVKKDLKELKALLLNKAETTVGEEKPIRVAEVAKLVGYKVQTIYKYCRHNEIPYHKKKEGLFFFKSEITDWIKQGKQKTLTEIEADTDAFLSNRTKTRK